MVIYSLEISLGRDGSISTFLFSMTSQQGGKSLQRVPDFAELPPDEAWGCGGQRCFLGRVPRHEALRLHLRAGCLSRLMDGLLLLTIPTF